MPAQNGKVNEYLGYNVFGRLITNQPKLLH